MRNITQEEREFILQYGDAEEQRLANNCHYLNEKVEAARKAAVELESLEKELEAAIREHDSYSAEYERLTKEQDGREETAETAGSGQPFTLSGAGWRLILEMEPRPERNETVLLKEVMEYLQAILDNSQCMSVKEQ